MLFRVQNLMTTVVECSDAEAAWLAEFASFAEKARHQHAGGWFTTTERVSLLSNDNVLGASLPTGLVPVVIRSARDKGFTVQVDDQRRRPCDPDPSADLRWLRDDQLAAVQACLKRGRGILDIGMAAGKTELAIALTRVLPCRWLLLTHRMALAEQAARRFDTRNIEHGLATPPAGLIADGNWSVGERLTCATYHSLAAGLRNEEPRARAVLLSTDGLFLDEIQFVGAPTAYYVAMHTPRAYYRFGASATALDRSDGRNIMVVAASGPVIYRLPASELIGMGLVAKPLVIMLPVQHPPEPPDAEKRPWHDSYYERIIVSPERNREIIRTIERCDKPALLFVTALRHGVALRRALAARGLRTDFIWGKKRVFYRAEAFAKLDRGELDVIVANVVAQDGVDCTHLRSVVVATAGRATIATLQRLGRGMRLADGKSTFTVYDFADRGCTWLERQTARRVADYRRESFDVEVRPLVAKEEKDVAHDVSPAG